jgi:hypothetical protein
MHILPGECIGEDLFRCSPIQCIPAAKQCDGVIDCVGGGDESNCTAGNDKLLMLTINYCLLLLFITIHYYYLLVYILHTICYY